MSGLRALHAPIGGVSFETRRRADASGLWEASVVVPSPFDPLSLVVSGAGSGRSRQTAMRGWVWLPAFSLLKKGGLWISRWLSTGSSIVSIVTLL